VSRAVRAVIALLALTLVPATAVGAAAATQAPAADARKGVVLDGLLPTAAAGACKGKFQVAVRVKVGGGPVSCTHGPDPAPDGVDVRRSRSVAELAPAATRGSAIVAAAAPSVPCYGDGASGYRVQVVFARSSDVADRYDALAASLVQWSLAADTVVSASAAETGGTRHIRFVTGPNCALSIARVTMPPSADDSLGATISTLENQGYTRTDRKYLVYVDANVYCGIGEMYNDDTFNTTPGVNANNGAVDVPGTVARVDNGCWGLPAAVEAHELMHNLGGVQSSAPHATANAHCTDEYDRMCYADSSSVTLTYVCPSSHERLFDCNHDDYFSTSPPAGSYLATHWNTADSVFLEHVDPTQTAPSTTSTTAPPTTSTTAAPTTTTTVAPTTTTTTAPPSTTTTTAPKAKSHHR